MTESEFISYIDCSFPYHAPLKLWRIVAMSTNISANSAFMVVHEACRIPRSQAVSKRLRRHIINSLFRRFRHPLKNKLKNVISSHINGQLLTVSAAIKVMHAVSKYPHQYNALALCYFACNDRKNLADIEYEKIVKRWENA